MNVDEEIEDGGGGGLGVRPFSPLLGKIGKHPNHQGQYRSYQAGFLCSCLLFFRLDIMIFEVCPRHLLVGAGYRPQHQIQESGAKRSQTHRGGHKHKLLACSSIAGMIA